MKLENAIEGDDSQSKQATRGSKEKKTRRSFLTSTAATAAVAGLGVVGTAAANDNVIPRYITITNHFDERANYYLEVSGSLEQSERYNATIDNHDELLNGGSAVSGHTYNGRDTYRYTGDIVSLGANQAIDIWLGGDRADPSTVLRDVITIQGPDASMASYELSIDGFFAKSSAHGATIDPNDTIASYTAEGQVGYNGRDSYATNGTVENLNVGPRAYVFLNGYPVEPDTLPEVTGS